MNKKTVIILVVVLAILGLAFFSYTVYKNRSNDVEDNTNYIDVVDDFNQNLDDSPADNSTGKETNSANENSPSENPVSSTDSADEPQNTPQKEEVGAILTRAEQKGQEVVVEGFAQTLRQDGICTIKLEHTTNGQKLEDTTKTTAQPSYVNCNALYLPLDRFKSAGTWTAQISYSNPQEKGISNQLEFEVSL